jgi:branched-chain amino acid transport system ATP-binding protein
MLAVSRALMSKPDMLLIDELSMGLAPILVQTLFDALIGINKSGVTILLVEQDAAAALDFSSRAYVIETGTVALSGKASELQNDDRVREIYLGG